MNQVILSFIRTPLLILALIGIFTPGVSAQISGSDQSRRVIGDGKGPKPKAPPSIFEEIEKEGVRIEFSAKATGEGGKGLVAGADTIVTFGIRDARPGRPLAGVRPLAGYQPS